MAAKKVLLPIDRRRLLQGASARLTLRSPSPFDLWSAELDHILGRLDMTPEVREADRDALHDRLGAVEELILDTPGVSAAAARAKSDLLWKLAAMERHEHTAALADVRAFIFKVA